MPSKEADYIKKYLKNLHFTASEKSGINSWLNDLVISKKYRINEIIRQSGIRKTLNDPKLNPKQKGEEIYRLVRKLRYPVLADYEEKFKSKAGELFNVTGIKFSSAPYFESSEITASFRFTNRKDLEKTIRNLTKYRNNIISLLE